MWNRFAERTERIPNSTEAQTIKARIAEEKAKGYHVIQMEIGTPNFDTPDYIKQAAIQSITDGDVFYCDSYGIKELREAIARKLERENGLDYKWDEVLVTCGGTEGIYLICSALLEEGDEVILCDPIWHSYMGCIEYFGGKPVFYHLKEDNNFQLDKAELESKITDKTKLIVVVSPNNPQGSVFSKDSLHAVADVAKKHDLLVLSDEIYDQILYAPEDLLSIASLPGMRERTITLNGMSKAFSMTGWRMGYLVAEKHILLQLYKIHARILSCLPVFVQKGAAEALNNVTAYKEEVAKMVTQYKRRRDYLVEHLNAVPGLSCKSPEGAFYLFLNTSGLGMTSHEAQDFLLREAHVATMPGATFGDGGDDGYVRLCYAVSYEDIVEACENIKQAVERLHKG